MSIISDGLPMGRALLEGNAGSVSASEQEAKQYSDAFEGLLHQDPDASQQDGGTGQGSETPFFDFLLGTDDTTTAPSPLQPPAAPTDGEEEISFLEFLVGSGEEEAPDTGPDVGNNANEDGAVSSSPATDAFGSLLPTEEAVAAETEGEAPALGGPATEAFNGLFANEAQSPAETDTTVYGGPATDAFAGLMPS